MGLSYWSTDLKKASKAKQKLFTDEKIIIHYGSSFVCFNGKRSEE